jgi:hypothetical protein
MSTRRLYSPVIGASGSVVEPTIWIAADVLPLSRLSEMNEMPLAANWSSVNTCVPELDTRWTRNVGRPTMATPGAACDQSTLTVA